MEIWVQDRFFTGNLVSIPATFHFPRTPKSVAYPALIVDRAERIVEAFIGDSFRSCRRRAPPRAGAGVADDGGFRAVDGEAGTLRDTLIINLPGSPRGATESFEAILDILPHAIETLRGEVQDDGRPDAAGVTGRVVRHGASRGFL